ncbi:MAG: YhcH/YjgK/YiaL family protein [Verrucomicrobiaceae bacterium]|nr:YhcH/YjgK/YiaL family protein [Verrucomicrobiaceae bacterium]
MILDTLANATRYEQLNSRFSKAFTFLRQLDGTQAPGRYDLDGDQCFALVQTYETKPLEKALFEAHRKYIDVQYLHSGQETILWAPVATMQDETMPFSAEKDAALWKLSAPSTPVHMSAGHFAILWPEDAHAPCIDWESTSDVYKVVIKVAVE